MQFEKGHVFVDLYRVRIQLKGLLSRSEFLQHETELRDLDPFESFSFRTGVGISEVNHHPTSCIAIPHGPYSSVYIL